VKLERVIETCLYVDDLDRAASFYEQVLGLTALTSDARFRAYDVGGQSVLLLFRRGATLETVRMPGGTIPPHDGDAGPVGDLLGPRAHKARSPSRARGSAGTDPWRCGRQAGKGVTCPRLHVRSACAP